MIGANCLAGSLIRPVRTVVDAVASIAPVRRGLERIDDVLLEPIARRVDARSVEAPATIELVDVRVHEEGVAVLDGISVELPAARHVAIAGPTGAGKSALAAAIAGMRPPDSGRIAVGGRDLARLTCAPARLVLPSVALFDGCVLDNIALAPADRTDETVETAARLAGVHEQIQALPLGYRASVYDGGANLPIAMRRRILIARALVGCAPILILDGAAAALGSRAEGEILHNVLTRGARQVLTVTEHRETIERADLVVVLDRGRLVDAGSPAALKTRCRAYRELVAPDSGGRAELAVMREGVR
jgi:ABC-type bacteriocin/lantibiotic exporter with double-glycine peptidase domain